MSATPYDKAVNRLALVLANAMSYPELPPQYASLDECADAAYFTELAQLAIDQAVVPMAMTVKWKLLREGEIPWEAVCSETASS